MHANGKLAMNLRGWARPRFIVNLSLLSPPHGQLSLPSMVEEYTTMASRVGNRTHSPTASLAGLATSKRIRLRTTTPVPRCCSGSKSGCSCWLCQWEGRDRCEKRDFQNGCLGYLPSVPHDAGKDTVREV